MTAEELEIERQAEEDRVLEAAKKALGGDGAELPRSLGLVALTRASGKGRVITFNASTDGLDRHGTKIMPMGINTERYEKNPIALWGHDGYGGWFSTPDPKNVVGRTVAIRKSEHTMEADIEFLSADVNPNADMVFKMTRAGAVNAVSIGFIPREVRAEVDDAGREIPIIVRSELLEISVVPIPSNPEALARALMSAMVTDEDRRQLRELAERMRRLEDTKGVAPGGQPQPSLRH